MQEKSVRSKAVRSWSTSPSQRKSRFWGFTLGGACVQTSALRSTIRQCSLIRKSRFWGFTLGGACVQTSALRSTIRQRSLTR